jgi:ABC-type dipeptide/oligopeptide/nickel transport system ATPase component
MLEIKNLTVSFLVRTSGAPEGEVFTAVRGIAMKVTEGSFTALVGESGSGKSVTALSICRLIVPFQTSGSILWGAGGRVRDLRTLPDRELLNIRGKEISYIFQDPAASLNPVLRVGPQIDEALTAHGGADRASVKKKTLEFLSSLKISDPLRFYDSFPHELSGGMKQRAMIAMALILKPRLLIADEPTTALDVSVEADIMKLLADIQKERSLAVLFITHNLNLASAVADNIYVMQKGSVVEYLEKKNGFRATQDYTKKLFAAELRGVKPKTLIGV